MKRVSVVVCVVVLAISSLAGCASSGTKKKGKNVPPPTVAAPNTPTAAEVEANVLAEAKKTAVDQLQCPEEEVTVSCTKHDAHGGCIAVQARGCGRTLEYDFGNDT
jgi:hypothetical protein